MVLALSSMPSLLLSRRLVPLKKKRVSKKSNRAAAKRVRAADEETKAETPQTATTPGYKVNGTPSTTSTPTPTSNPSTDSTPTVLSKAKTVGARLLESMKLRGGAPELIAGRCSMLTIPCVVAYEMAQKETLLQLIASHKTIFAVVVGIITLGTLIPIGRGSKYEAFGFMTPHAELTNGRAAIIGILAILILEAKSGTYLF